MKENFSVWLSLVLIVLAAILPFFPNLEPRARFTIAITILTFILLVNRKQLMKGK